MKKLAFTLLLCVTTAFSMAQNKNLQALFSYKTFYSPENGPYVETYLSVNAQTVQYVKLDNGKFQGSIHINLKFTDASDVVKYTDSYNLLSPEVDDENNVSFHFLDEQRIPLANGRYKFELEISDRNGNGKPYAMMQPVSVEYYDNIVKFSDIELIETYAPTTQPSIISKSGYDLVPMVDNFYPHQADKLRFYVELYNADKVLADQSYLINYHLETSESKLIIQSLKGFTRMKPERVNVLMREIPIADLPSGNYHLIVEARNQQNEVLATGMAFIQRSNQNLANTAETDFRQQDVSNTFASFITNRDSLIEYINSLYPIAGSLETLFITNQLKLADVPMMQRFFYDFWSKRNPQNPEQAWLTYKIEVAKVEKEFGTRTQRGYTTDRGRVYLQYGPPNSMTQYLNEPSAYPYEIWHYYKIESQSNRKFVFYNPDLVTNDFRLLHSDAQGEIANSRWELDLHKRDTQSNDFDQTRKGNEEFYYGNKASDNFANPK